MRKFIALGLSAVTAGSIVLTAAGPAAHAEETTPAPKSIVEQVCDAVPSVGTSITDQLADLTDKLAADETAVADAKTKAQTATAAYIDAAVNYLKDTAANSADLPISTSALSVRTPQFVDAIAAWGDALTQQTQDNGMFEFLTLQNGALGQLGDGLGCVAPVAAS